MNRTLRRIIAIFCLVAILGVAAWSWRDLTRPTVLSIAVGPPHFDDAAFVASLARGLAGAGADIRLSVEQTSGPNEALQRLKEGKAQLAVIRNLGDAPDQARAIAILHSDPVTVVAPKSAKIENFRDLANKTLGLVGPPGSYSAIMDRMRIHYRGKFASIDIPPVVAKVADAINDKKADALLFIVPTTKGVAMSESWAAVRKLTKKSMSFVAIDDAEAIAAAAPIYEEGEISAGAFGGAPPIPEENVTTLLVTTYLVADQSVGQNLIAKLTRFIFENRQRLIPDAPVAALVKAASTDKDAMMPAHMGAKVFFDGEEQTLLEQYGDWVYIGPVIFGGVYSTLLALWRLLRTPREEEAPLFATVPELIRSIKNADSLANLDAISAQVDGAIERISAAALDGKLENVNVGANSLIIAHINRLLREKRVALEHASGPKIIPL